jgi:hypothetical protein
MTSGLARLLARVGEGTPCSQQKLARVRLVWSVLTARRSSGPCCPLLVLPLWLPRRSEDRGLAVPSASETKALVTMLMCLLSAVMTFAAAVSRCRLSWTRCYMVTPETVCRRSVVMESGDGMGDRSLADGDAAVTYPRASARLESRTTPIVLLDIGRLIS